MFPRIQEKHDAIAENLYDLFSYFGCRDVRTFFMLPTHSLYYKEGRSPQTQPVSIRQMNDTGP